MPNNHDWRVLIIDDEEDIREVVCLALTDAGYNVETAADGILGLERCQSLDPQIVLTDIRMPRMDGIQLLERIKQQYADMEVIVATAFAEIDLAVKALQLDASDFITKPISNDALMVALERAKQRYTTRHKLQEYTRFLEEGWSETTRELMETIAYQKRLIESSMDGILGCNAEDVVITFNQSMEQMSGYTKSQAMHRMTLDQFFESGEAAKLDTELKSKNYGGTNFLFLYETHMRSVNGSPLPVQISATRLENQGTSEGLVCFIRDLRRIHKLEQQMANQARILHQDKMMSLGRLAASVAHEINNPLAGVLNYIRLMARLTAHQTIDTNQLTKFQRYLDVVEQETDRCSRIVSNLLTFARKTPAMDQAVDIDELMQRCIVLSQHRLQLGNIELDTRIDPNLPQLKGDINQLQQCIINLIFNAVDAMPEGGRLQISAASANSQRVRIQVKDNGTGIATEDLPHIFEPFFTTKQEGHGTGLGLSTTYGIIERHNGTIEAHSQPGRGSTFHIELPGLGREE